VFYLAGKCNGPKWEAAKAIQHRFHSIEFYASDADEYSEHGWSEHGWGMDFCLNSGLGEEYVRSQVLVAVLEHIQASDFLFAYLDTPDCFGTIAEIAWASAHRIPSIVAVKKVDNERWEAFYDAYWLVCTLPHVYPRMVDEPTSAAEVLEFMLDVIFSYMMARRRLAIPGAQQARLVEAR
jgi:hypothetical protein